MKAAVRISIQIALVLAMPLMLATITGCTSCHSEPTETQSSKSTASESEDANISNNENGHADSLSGLIDKGASTATELSKELESAIDNAKNSQPIRVRIGKWARATDNLEVRVDSVEQGPYDSSDSTPTMKVTVSMKNLTDHTLTVKASNWNADNTDGQRVDHKLWVKNGNGSIEDRSFELTRISPDSVFTGTVYFDGNGLVDVVYEPHWLLSGQNQYIYFVI